jgi:hypothetical protein
MHLEPFQLSHSLVSARTVSSLRLQVGKGTGANSFTRLVEGGIVSEKNTASIFMAEVSQSWKSGW